MNTIFEINKCLAKKEGGRGVVSYRTFLIFEPDYSAHFVLY